MTILALDPGETTGYVVVTRLDDGQTVVNAGGQFSGWSDMDRIITNFKIDLILYERFAILSANVSPIPLQVIGVIKYVAHLHKIPIIGQMPNIRKAILKRYPNIADHLTATVHYRDAFLHVMTYIWQTFKGLDYRGE